MRSFRLTIGGRTVTVPEEVTLGREHGSFVAMSGGDHKVVICAVSNQEISRPHFKLFLREGAIMLQDLGSLNGTWVDGEMVPGWAPRRPSAPIRIPSGSTVTCGELYIQVTLEGGTTAETDGPPARNGADLQEIRKRAEMAVAEHRFEEALTLYREVLFDAKRVSEVTQIKEEWERTHPRHTNVSYITNTTIDHSVVSKTNLGSDTEQAKLPSPAGPVFPKCNGCGEELPTHAKFCPACSQPVGS